MGNGPLARQSMVPDRRPCAATAPCICALLAAPIRSILAPERVPAPMSPLAVRRGVSPKRWSKRSMPVLKAEPLTSAAMDQGTSGLALRAVQSPFKLPEAPARARSSPVSCALPSTKSPPSRARRPVASTTTPAPARLKLLSSHWPSASRSSRASALGAAPKRTETSPPPCPPVPIKDDDRIKALAVRSIVSGPLACLRS